MLSPFPEGWSFIASRKTIEKAKLFQASMCLPALRQTCSSCLCSAMRNFSFLSGDIDGNGLIRSLYFAGDTSKVK